MWENSGVLILSEGRSTNLVYSVFANMFKNAWVGKEEFGWTERLGLMYTHFNIK